MCLQTARAVVRGNLLNFWKLNLYTTSSQSPFSGSRPPQAKEADDKLQWSDEATKVLFSVYSGLVKGNTVAKDIWDQVARHFYDEYKSTDPGFKPSKEQCKNKYNNHKKHMQKVLVQRFSFYSMSDVLHFGAAIHHNKE